MSCLRGCRFSGEQMQTIYTKVNGDPWRAILSRIVLNPTQKRKGFDSSSWSIPTGFTVRPSRYGTALNFPYTATEAQYVWAHGGGVNSHIAWRLIVNSACAYVHLICCLSSHCAVPRWPSLAVIHCAMG